ncbi:MAG: hypothetical protein ACTS47_00945 [Candidatus Hodgkinia cicadicola]
MCLFPQPARSDHIYLDVIALSNESWKPLSRLIRSTGWHLSLSLSFAFSKRKSFSTNWRLDKSSKGAIPRNKQFRWNNERSLTIPSTSPIT